MDTELTQPLIRAPRPLSALTTLTLASLLGTVLVFGAMQLFVMRAVEPTIFIPMVLLLGAAVLMVTRWRWTPVVAAILSGLLLFGLLAPALDQIVYELIHPGMPMGPLLLALIPLLAIGFGAGLAATVQNYRSRHVTQRFPRWSVGALIALAGIVIGASTLHMVAAPASGASMSPEILASLPALTARDFAFDQAEIHVRAGELAAFRLTNLDSMPHSFDLDEFDVHIPMLPGEDGVAIFRPTEPGTYTFYCAPHYNKRTGEGMKGRLIVEP